MLLLQWNRETNRCGQLFSTINAWTNEVISECCRNNETKSKPCDPERDPSSCRQLFSIGQDDLRAKELNRVEERDSKLPAEMRSHTTWRKMCLSLDEIAHGVTTPTYRKYGRKKEDALRERRDRLGEGSLLASGGRRRRWGIDELKNVAQVVSNGAQEAGEKTAAAGEKTAKDAARTTQEAAQKTAAAAKEAGEKTVNTVSNTAQSAVNTVSNTVQSAVDSAKDGIMSAVDSAKDGIIGFAMKEGFKLSRQIIRGISSLSKSSKDFLILLIDEYEDTNKFDAVKEKFLITVRPRVKCICS